LRSVLPYDGEVRSDCDQISSFGAEDWWVVEFRKCNRRKEKCKEGRNELHCDCVEVCGVMMGLALVDLSSKTCIGGGGK